MKIKNKDRYISCYIPNLWYIYFAESTVAVLTLPTFNMVFENRKCACLFAYIW